MRTQKTRVTIKFLVKKSDLCSKLLNFRTDTPDYKGLQVELETTETCYTSFLSLKRPDFKNVIFKILEVSPCDSPAKQHSPFGPNQGGSG